MQAGLLAQVRHRSRVLRGYFPLGGDGVAATVPGSDQRRGGRGREPALLSVDVSAVVDPDDINDAALLVDGEYDTVRTPARPAEAV